MSVRPEEQALTPSITKIIEGFDNFHAAAVKRIRSQDFTRGHEQELVNIGEELRRLEYRLVQLQSETW
jgi:hypothetical protein